MRETMQAGYAAQSGAVPMRPATVPETQSVANELHATAANLSECHSFVDVLLAFVDPSPTPNTPAFGGGDPVGLLPSAVGNRCASSHLIDKLNALAKVIGCRP